MKIEPVKPETIEFLNSRECRLDVLEKVLHKIQYMATIFEDIDILCMKISNFTFTKEWTDEEDRALRVPSKLTPKAMKKRRNFILY